MVDILTAIKSAFEGDSTLSTAYETLWAQDAPPASAYPYAMQFIVDSNADDAFGANFIEATDVQVSLYHTSLVTLYTHIKLVCVLLDRAALTFTDGTRMGIQRTNRMVNHDPADRTKDGDPVYHAWARFKVRVDRARASN